MGMNEIIQRFQKIYSDLLALDQPTVKAGVNTVIIKDGRYTLFGIVEGHGYWQTELRGLGGAYFMLLHQRGLIPGWDECQVLGGRIEQALIDLRMLLNGNMVVDELEVFFGADRVSVKVLLANGFDFCLYLEQLAEQVWIEHLQRLMAG